MSPFEVFIWGFCGSVAVEVVALLRYYETEARHLPPRYRKRMFWILRVLLAVIGGGLALAYKIESAILAANIGASAPLILQALAQGVGNVPSTSDRIKDSPTDQLE
jgi:hypothetical protein